MSSTVTFRRTRTLFSTPTTRGEKTSSSTTAQEPPIRLWTFEELPEWYQDNPFIQTAYRPVPSTLSQCIHFLTYLHNETLNIYTHAIPALLTLLLAAYFHHLLHTRFPHASTTDHFILLHNILVVSATFTLSANYHTFMPHSPTISHMCLCFDYIGILLLTHASFVSGIYVGFFADPHLRKVYWAMITILASVTALFVLHPRLKGVRFRPHRTLGFVATGLSGFAPIVHGLIRYGWEEMWRRSAMPWWLAEGAVYGIGAFLFALRFPECLGGRWRGRFDVWGSSHQLFHVLVVVAAWLHLWGTWKAWERNYLETYVPISR